MKSGKLNWDELKYIIDDKKILRKDVTIRNGIGEDCSVINYGDYECVLSTDPITGSEENIGRLAVHINCNDIASCGVNPIGILVTILAPESASIDDIKKIMNEINEETEKLNVEILGGHTEFTSCVNKIIISCTVVGKQISGKSIATSGAQYNDDIIVTKYLCMEGTSIIVNDYYEKIKKILSYEELGEAKEYIKNISVVKEGVIGGEFEANSMHDITEGGILGALWEVAKCSNLGFKVYKDKMPISNVTKKICSKFNIDPLRFISSGSMLITTKNGQQLVNKLRQEGIKATIIGKVTKEKGILIHNEKEEEVLPPKRDELFVLKEKIDNI